VLDLSYGRCEFPDTQWEGRAGWKAQRTEGAERSRERYEGAVDEYRRGLYTIEEEEGGEGGLGGTRAAAELSGDLWGGVGSWGVRCVAVKESGRNARAVFTRQARFC